MEELIDLQSAHVTQLTSSGVKSDWIVKKNITGDILHIFPPSIPDALMFEILDFAKKYELIAFNAGIKFQKKNQNLLLTAQIKELEAVNTELGEENIRLATILENILPQE